MLSQTTAEPETITLDEERQYLALTGWMFGIVFVLSICLASVAVSFAFQSRYRKMNRGSDYPECGITETRAWHDLKERSYQSSYKTSNEPSSQGTTLESFPSFHPSYTGSLDFSQTSDGETREMSSHETYRTRLRRFIKKVSMLLILRGPAKIEPQDRGSAFIPTQSRRDAHSTVSQLKRWPSDPGKPRSSWDDRESWMSDDFPAHYQAYADYADYGAEAPPKRPAKVRTASHRHSSYL